MASDIKKNTREERAAQFAAHLQNNSLNNYLRTSEAPKVEEETRDRTGEWLDKGKRIYGRMIMQSLLPGSAGVFAAGELLGKVARTIAPEAVERVEDFLSPTVDTVRHGVDTVKEGAFKSLEGVVDWGAGIVGSFGNENFRDNVQDFIERDYVGDWFDQDYYQERKEESVINEGGFVENALSAAGGMLPAIGAYAINPFLGQAVMFAGTAGNESEQAYQDGAGYYAGQIYGNTKGAIALGTEKLFGLMGNFGKGAFDGVLRSVAPSGVARWALGAASEGLEEGVEELASPLAKVIYKGADALQEYKTGDYWRGVGESVALGTTLGGAFGMANVGANADIRAAQEEIGAIEDRLQRLDERGKKTTETEARADADILANYRVIEDVLKKADATKRAELIKKNGLSSLFSADGTLNADFVKGLDGSGDIRYNRKYYSRDLVGREKVIQRDLDAINADLVKRFGDEAETVSVYDGELSEKAASTYGKVKKFLNVVGKKTGGGVGLVVTNNNAKFEGVNVGGNVYMTPEDLESGKVYKTLVEETTHYAEGTAEHSALVRLLSSDRAFVESTVERLLENPNYGFDAAKLRAIGDKIARGEVDASVFGKREASIAELRYRMDENGEENSPEDFYTATKDFGKRVYKEDKDDFSRWLANKTMDMADGEVKVINIYCYKAIYIFYATGYMKGHLVSSKLVKNVDSRRRSRKEFKNAVDRAGKSADFGIGEIPTEGRGQGSDLPFLGSGETAVRDDGLSSEKPERERTTDSGSVRRNSYEIDRAEIDKLLKALKEMYGDPSDSSPKFSFKENVPEGEVNQNDHAMYAEFASELGAHMSAEMLGNEAFIDRVIRSDASLAEKIIGKIIDAKDALGRIGDPEAQTQHKRLVAAEKLYLKAIEAAGYQYVNGKIVVPEEDKEKSLTGMNEENMQVSGEDGRIRYAMKDSNTTGFNEYSVSSALYDALDHKDSGYDNLIKVGRMPQYVVNKFGIEGDFYIYRDHAYENMVTQEQAIEDGRPIQRNNKKIHFHGLGVETMTEAILSLNEPIIVIDDTSKNGNPEVVMMLPIFGNNNAPLCAVLSFYNDQAINGDFSRKPHIVLTVTPREWTGTENRSGWAERINEAIEENRIIDFEKGKRTDLSVIAQLTRLGNITDGSLKNSLAEFQKKVKAFRQKHKISYSLKDRADGKRPTSYTKEEARGLVDRVMELFSGEGYSGALPGKRAEAIQRAHAILNGAEPGKRAGAALDFADYLIRSAVLEDDVTANPDYEIHVQTLEALKPYLRRLDLDSIREEIYFRYDDKAKAVLARWGKTRNSVGVSVGELVEGLRNVGYGVSDHSDFADMFFEIDRDYCEARDALKENAKTAVREVFTEKEQKALRQQIAKEVLAAYDGRDFSRATLTRIANKYADDVERLTTENRRLADEARKSRAERDRAIAEKNDAKEKAAKAKAETKDVEEFNKVSNRVIKLVNGIKDWKKGTFENAADAKSGTFKNIFGLLGNIASRGNISPITTRKAMAAIGEWYGKPDEHPVVEDLKASKMYDESMKEAMKAIGSGEGALTVEELRAVEGILQHVKHIVENYNKTFYKGKYVEVKPLAEDFIAIAEENQRIHPGVISRVMKGKFMSFVTRPISVMRYHDRYNKNGFLTTMFLEFRKGALAAELAKHQMRKPLEDFYREHSDFLGDIKHKKITVEGVEMTRAEALSLYMTAKREQAVGGIMAAGFNVRDAKTQEMRGMKGLLETEDMQGEVDLIALQEATSKFRRRLWDGFTADERRFIEIAEDILNNDCKARKSKVDEIRLGYSNVLEEYYYPIRRGNTAQEIGDDTLGSELGRIRSFSFNKATVTGAKGKLFIEPADVVLERHIAGIALYENLSIPIDNYNRIANLDVVGKKHDPKTVIKVISENGGWSEAGKYFDKLIEDLEGIRVDKDWSTDALAFIRTGSVKFQLGANPKTWITQLSSLFASMSVIHPKYLGTTGFRVDGAELDTYSPLAMLRNMENTAAKAQGVMENVGAVGDKLMKPIGWFDRYVIRHLWNACQAQVEGEQGLKRGTVENKKAAAALLEEAIFETQQNSLLTERSAAMRSHNEITKAFTMYSADAMELTGRFLDAFGEVSVLKAKLRHAEGATKTALEAEIKAAQKKARSSAASMAAVSAYMAVIAYLFSKAYGRRDDDETVGDIARDFAADFAGNLLGGLPFIRDIYSYFNDGYEVNTYFLSSINDMLQGANGIKNLVSDAITGKEVTAQEVASRVRSLFYATGQIFGIPIRNMYNATRGVVGAISPEGGYAMDSMFYNKNYRNDLASALEKGDEKKVSTIAQIMLDEDFGGMSSAARKKLKELIEDGYDVLPRSVGDYVTVDGEQLKFTARQRKQFEKVYGVADKAVEDLVRMSKFRKLTSKEQAKAINFIYETYYDLATEDVFGVDLAEKNILFAEAIDIEKLALFVTAARSIEGDKDKNGKTISGSKKAKVTAYVESLNISAAEKYMLMGYLGYKNKNGEAQVKAYINKLRLTKTEKEALLGYSGYEVKKAS